MNKVKIGIISIYDNDNYGNKLQNYAVQNILESRNFDVETIKNRMIKKNKYYRYFAKNILNKLMFLHKKDSNYYRFYKFLEFDNKIKKNDKVIINKKSFDKIINNYDYFIIGSDQVWNPYFGTNDALKFGDLHNNKKNISFSASFGISEISNEYIDFYKKGLKNMNNISVREEAGKKIVNDLTGRTDVEVLLDPTMLLSDIQWDIVSNKPDFLNNEKYILLYFLGGISIDRMNVIESYAKNNNLLVIDMIDKKSKYSGIGPSEFLYLEKNAELICTDSFHSCVFGILFKTPFLIYRRDQEGVSMNSRIETLLNTFKLEDRVYNNVIDDKILSIDFSKCDKILDKKRKEADKFLDNTLK